MWMWLGVGIIVVVVILGGGYFLAKKAAGPAAQTVATPTAMPTQPAAVTPGNNIYMMKTDPAKGTYLADPAGMTLYVYSKDTPGVSNCTGTCAVNWPPYISKVAIQGVFPPDVSVTIRADGSKQFAWKGLPLYYFKSDTTAGQITGDGVGGFTLAK